MRNEKLIATMSFDKRIELITGIDLYSSRIIDGYDFPVFTLQENPLGEQGIRATTFPSDCALSQTFNRALIRRAYSFIGCEAKVFDRGAFYHIGAQAADGASDDYLTANLLAAKMQGLRDGGATVGFADGASETDTAEQKTTYRLFADAVLSKATPDAVLTTPSTQTDILGKYGYKGLKFGVADTKEEVARYLNDGYSYIFLTHDFTEELTAYLRSLVNAYQTAYEACVVGRMTIEQLRENCRQGKMLSPASIDFACDNIVDLLVAFNTDFELPEAKTALDENVQPTFDEVTHDRAALNAALESIVLLKNSNGILPLRAEMRVAVLGECAKDPTYELSGNVDTFDGLPFDVINDYDIQTVGFAYGYRRGEPHRNDLWTTACKLCANADVALVYCSAEPNAEALPLEQLQLLDVLYERGVKTIAVVAADGAIDMDFADKCGAVLFTERGGQRAVNAVFDILTGVVNPSGRLAFPVTTEDGNVRYPFGYGLSYTSFAYENLQVTDGGATLTVTNTGLQDGYATVQLYGQSANKARRLIGFEKVFIKKRDAVKVAFKFDDSTFRTFDERTGKFVIVAGKYVVSVGEHAADVKAAYELTLEGYVFDAEKVSVEKLDTRADESAFDDFVDSADRRAYYSKPQNAIGFKIALAVLLALYCTASAIVILAFNLVPQSILSYVFTVGIAVVADILVFIYVLHVSKPQPAPPRPPMLGEVVEGLSAFTELAHVKYDEPIADAPTVMQEETEEEAEPEEEAVREDLPYDTDFTEIENRPIAYRASLSLTELCDGFFAYARGMGVELDAQSVRSIFAALAASKLILVDAKDRTILPYVAAALAGWFGGQAVSAQPEWCAPDDLYWTAQNGKYVASEFVNVLLSASASPERTVAAVVENVHTEQLQALFTPFIRQALTPSESHAVALNSESVVELSKNLHYILLAENGWDALPAEVAACSVQIELNGKSVMPSGEVEATPVSALQFAEAISEARDKHYLTESVWKKLDDFVASVAASERFALGNKTVIQLERLTAVLLACGADNDEALNAVFTCKLVARLKLLPLYAEDGGERKIFGIIEKCFADENLAKVKRALAKTGG